MWPFRKNPHFGSQVDEIAPSVDQEFGTFAPFFASRLNYLALLNLQKPTAAQAISLVMKCCAATSNPYRDIVGLLRQVSWRPHVVGAVAIATVAPNPAANDELWAAIDKGSWVTPQLAAVAFLRDALFADHARERLRSGCRIVTSGYAGLSAVERHVLIGPGRAVERSAKTAAALVRLIELLPEAPDWRNGEVLSADLLDLVDKDVDSSGMRAETWLRKLKKELVELGVAAAGGAFRE